MTQTEPTTYERSTVSYETARRLLEAAVGAAREAGMPVTIVVSDVAGEPIAIARTDGVGLLPMKVAADKAWGTPKCVEFARHAGGLGADVLMVSPPDWGRSGTPDTFARHFDEVSRHIPVMLVTGAFLPRGEAAALAVMRATLEQAPGAR